MINYDPAITFRTVEPFIFKLADAKCPLEPTTEAQQRHGVSNAPVKYAMSGLSLAEERQGLAESQPVKLWGGPHAGEFARADGCRRYSSKSYRGA